MFTGFATENTPAIQVWDCFQQTPSAPDVRSIALADDCPPIQYFKTGRTSTANTIRVYLPTAPIEGKQLTIVNQQYNSATQSISVYSSDRSGNGASVNSALYTVGPGDSLILIYSNQNITFGNTGGNAQTGWTTLNKAALSASNNGAVVIGGNSNSASSTNAFVGGGSGNTANGSWSGVFGGLNNTASGFGAAVFSGSGNTASNQYAAVVGGQSNTASATNAIVIGGVSNIADGTNNVVVGGNSGTTRGIIGNFVTPASSAPIVNSSGIQQLATLLLGRQTTDATATRLASNISAAATTNQVILPNNSAYYFRGSITSGVTGGGASAMWSFEGGIKRGANAASTTLIQSVINRVAADAGASTWIVAISADTTNGGLAVTVTGQASTTIRWVCKIETTEMTF